MSVHLYFKMLAATNVSSLVGLFISDVMDIYTYIIHNYSCFTLPSIVPC